jgi:diketogulonate reductase-like aldo/keto reductase
MSERRSLIPSIGIGTERLRERVCVDVVEQALRLGYRPIDTAEGYEKERDVGEGLRASGVRRRDIFVTTKISPSHFVPRELGQAVKVSLTRLRLSEIELLLLHLPNPHVPLADALGALSNVKRAGLTYS